VARCASGRVDLIFGNTRRCWNHARIRRPYEVSRRSPVRLLQSCRSGWRRRNGEVYRAVDARLDHDVAIKMPPSNRRRSCPHVALRARSSDAIDSSAEDARCDRPRSFDLILSRVRTRRAGYSPLGRPGCLPCSLSLVRSGGTNFPKSLASALCDLHTSVWPPICFP